MGTQSSILFLTSLTSSLYNISSNPGFLNRQSLIDYKTKGAYAFKRMLNLSNIWTRQFGKTKTANHSLAYSNLWHRSPFSRCSQSWWTLQKDRKNNKMKINKKLWWKTLLSNDVVVLRYIDLAQEGSDLECVTHHV